CDTQEQAYDLICNSVQRSEILLPIEKHLVSRLLEKNPTARLAKWYEIVAEIDRIVERLSQPARIAETSYLGIIVNLGANQSLTGAILEQDENLIALDTESQRQFIEHDLQNARIIRRSGTQDSYTLTG